MSPGAEPPANPSVDPGPHGRAAWKVRIAVTFFSVSLALVAAESLARRFASADPPPLFQEHPLVGLLPTPGELVNPRAPAARRASFVLDRFGLRGASLETRERPKGVFRILFLGDEQTFAAGTPEEDTFPGRVERELTKLRGPDDLKIEVANAGLPGASTPVLYSHLVHRLLALEPDLVVVSCSAGDVRLSQRLPEGGLLETFAPEAREAPGLWDWFAGVSELARLARARLAPRVPRLSGPPLGSPDTTRGVAITRRYLHLMALACKDAHCDLVLLTEPALWKTPLSPEERRTLRWPAEQPSRSTHEPGGEGLRSVQQGGTTGLPTATGEKGAGSAEELRGALETWNDAIRSAAAREGATLVDLAPVEVVPRNLSYFESDLELTPVGHAVVAQTIVTVVFADKPAVRRP